MKKAKAIANGLILLGASAAIVGFLWMYTSSPEIPVQRVRMVYPTTYFPSELQIGFENKGDQKIKSVRFTARSIAPNTANVLWSRKVTCSVPGGLSPDDEWFGACEFEGPPPKKKHRSKNAAVHVRAVSISKASDS